MANQLAVQGDRHQEIRAVAEIKHFVPVAQFLKWCEFLYVMDNVLWKEREMGLDIACYSCSFLIILSLSTRFPTKSLSQELKWKKKKTTIQQKQTNKKPPKTKKPKQN